MQALTGGSAYSPASSRAHHVFRFTPPAPPRAGRGLALPVIRFVGKVCRHEWDWSPDDGIQSARDVVAELLPRRRAARREAVAVGGRPPPGRKRPRDAAAAAATLRGIRETTIGTCARRVAADEASTRAVAQSAISLAQLDAHALGALGVLQRLIDPSRAAVSPR